MKLTGEELMFLVDGVTKEIRIGDNIDTVRDALTKGNYREAELVIRGWIKDMTRLVELIHNSALDEA